MFRDIRFWEATGERAAKTAAQAAILAILGSGMMSEAAVNAFTVNWLLVLGFAIGGAVLSVLTSIISAPFGSNRGPSLSPAETIEPDPIIIEVPAQKKTATARKRPASNN